ncbi:hypothetical protein CTheo_6141 [Ceratobasidium theobromae]|uniref:Effector protein n=1 Tax=Ceratobasidium theobromae TaxID=1582974 RepID=A0A5N5QFI4_9AGAM|nr:hypothetical protein CTheo_6141 [Ceratobasidium theobromae]
MRLLAIFTLTFALLAGASFAQDTMEAQPAAGAAHPKPTKTLAIEQGPIELNREPMITARAILAHDVSTTSAAQLNLSSTVGRPMGGQVGCVQNCLRKAAGQVGCGSL